MTWEYLFYLPHVLIAAAVFAGTSRFPWYVRATIAIVAFIVSMPLINICLLYLFPDKP